MAVLLILTKISSRAIVGVGTSLNTNCPPYFNNLTAFMRGLLKSAQWAPRARAPQDSEHASHLHDAINLVATVVDAVGFMEHAVFGENLVDGGPSARAMVLTEDVM